MMGARRRAMLLGAIWIHLLVITEARGAARFVNRSSAPRDLVTFQEITYFSADDGIHGRELWRSDGTESGTWMVLDTVRGAIGGNPEGFAATESRLFFAITDPSNQRRTLWMSDGTPAGTARVTESPFDASVLLSSPSSNGKVVFCVTEKPGFSQLIRTDGTAAGTNVIEGDTENITRFNAGLSHAGHFIHLPGATYFLLHESEIFLLPDDATIAKRWGTKAFTRFIGQAGERFLLTYRSEFGREPMELTETMPGKLVRDILPGAGPGIEVGWDESASNGDLVFFNANDGVHGRELWRSDGTAEGTYLLRDIFPGEQSSQAGILTRGERLIYFVASDGVHGREPWVTDGTPAGTHMILDVYRGPRDSEPYRLHTVGDTLYFSALNERAGEELWRSDGTADGTAIVRDIVPGTGSAEPYYKSDAGGKLFFSASDGIHGFELWVTDGSSEGTRMVRDIAPVMGENPSSTPSQLYAAGALLYFTARSGATGTELWRSDGTDDGTFMVSDLFPGPASGNPGNFCALGDALLFSAETPNHGIELWRTGGTAASTVLVKEFAAGAKSGSPTGMVAINEKQAVFSAWDEVYGVELWITDGTERGTRLLRNIHEESNESRVPNSAYPRNFTRVEEVVYFSADDGEHGVELWVTDGTRAGTRMVKDLIPRKNFGTEPEAITSLGETTFFKGRSDAEGERLWRIQEDTITPVELEQ